jgi:O-acetyl-ADP-ribose deacetylase (regulator of RNase III)
LKVWHFPCAVGNVGFCYLLPLIFDIGTFWQTSINLIHRLKELVQVLVYGNSHVYNLATQQHYCIPSQLAKREYIDTSMEKMMQLAERSGVNSIAMPKIGAGLGGLKWEDVKAVIEKVSSTHPTIDLYVVENFSPTM